MENQRILIGSILAMLSASFVATCFGHSLLGFLLFMFALTPLPFQAAHWPRRRRLRTADRRDGDPGSADRRAVDFSTHRRSDERTRT